MAFTLYKLVVRLYGLAISIAGAFNEKAKQWRAGRKNWKKNLEEKISNFKAAEVLWFHCASYGEFEQGRPLIEAMHNKKPHAKILVTFFSPSGYVAFKDWTGADLVFYLPLDTPSNARDFLSIVNPSTVFIVKYEYWLCFLKEIKKRKIPAYLISATFKEHQPFFKWYGGVFRASLASFTKIFVQDKASLLRLEKIQCTNAVLSGDTRVDRVLAIKETAFENQQILDFKGDNYLLIAGSTWPEDESLLIDTFVQLNNPKIKLLIAPHELSEAAQEKTVGKLEALGYSVSLYSKGIEPSAHVLIVDAMGLLSKIYRYANVAYVGGGFEDGIHNMLEPAVYGIPVIIAGDGYHKHNEAVELLARKAAFHVSSAFEFSEKIDYLKNTSAAITTIKQELENYFEENKNVTARIIEGM